MIEQQTFLGASIRGFNGEFGRNDTPTTLTVRLVEDRRRHEYIDPPFVGQPVEFRFTQDTSNPTIENTYYFAGILNGISDDKGEAGNRVIDVNLADPRIFLDGVQLITGGFSKVIPGISNIYNTFLFYESTGYGNAQVNSLGMRADMILSALDAMVSNTPINFAGAQYFLDMSELPSVGMDYRIGEETISLLEFVSDICEIANQDYYCELVRTPLGWVIKFRTMIRGYVPRPGSLTEYIDSLTGVSSKNMGTEYNYSGTKSKVIIGGQIEYMLFEQPSTGTEITYGPPDVVNVHPDSPPDKQVQVTLPNSRRIDNGTVAKFWGTDQNGNLIYSYLNPGSIDADNEIILVPAYEIGFPYYVMTVGELRAASVSQDAWQSYLAVNDYPGSIHYEKSHYLKIKSEIKQQLNQLFSQNQLTAIPPSAIINLSHQYRMADYDNAFNERVYSFVRQYATEYYGVKYSVAIPGVLSKIDPDDWRLKSTSILPSSSGYLSEVEAFYSVLGELLPEYFSFVQDEDGKITCYVRYDNHELLNLGNLILGEDYIIDYDFRGLSLKKNVFVRCEVDENIYFGNATLGTDPRAVITLPGKIFSLHNNDHCSTIADAYFTSQNIPIRDQNGNRIDDDDKVVAARTAAFQAIVGGDNLLYDADPHALKPNLVAVPLRDTINTYGPWYAGGESGRVEIEQNEDMVPWNFGGYETMNAVGLRLVQDILLNSAENEVGSISLPGVHVLGPGIRIVNDGPYIEGVNVSIGEDGVITNFRYGKSEIKTGRMLEYQVNRLRKEVELRKNIAITQRDLYNRVINGSQFTRTLSRHRPQSQAPRRQRPNSSSPIIMGQIIDRADDKSVSTVSTMPSYHVQQYVAEDYAEKSGMSLDGLFRPYEVNGTGDKLPVYNLPEEEEGIDSRALFPFKEGHDVCVVLRGDEPSESVKNELILYKPDQELPPDTVDPPEPEPYDEKVRPLALKGPVVISGWGYDVDGKPVPNENEESPTDNFAEDYLAKSQLWKTGPLDCRWDNDRNVWVTGSSTDIREGTLTSEIIPAVSGDTDFTITSNGETINCKNASKTLSIIDYEDTYIIVGKINGKYRVLWVDC